MRKDTTAGAARNSVLGGPPDRTAVLYLLTDELYRAKTMSKVYDAALDAIVEALDCRRASVLLFDSDNVMRFVAWRGLSEHYRKTLEGHTPWKPGEREPLPLFIEDIEATTESRAVKDTIRAEGIKALAFVPLIAEGTVVGKFMTYYEDPRHFTEDERALALTIARQVGFSLERHRSERARQAAERELRQSEERFRAMSELAPVMAWLSDEAGACLHLNRSLRTFWGIDSDAIAGFDWRHTMHPEDAAEIGRRMADAISKQTAVRIKGRYRNSAGEYRVLETSAEPRLSENGVFLGLVGVNIDVTDQEIAEAHRDLLLAELNHRVKNTLAVVQGIANQTFKADRPMHEAKQAFDGRIAALAGAHDLLTTGTDELASLTDLVSDALRTRGLETERSRMSGPDLLLPPRHAMAVAMALHELFTNAVKYGAFSNDHGKVSVAWTTDSQQLKLRWRERDGPPVNPPSRRGFGSKLLERALANVGGTAARDFAVEGLMCEMTVPLPRSGSS